MGKQVLSDETVMEVTYTVSSWTLQLGSLWGSEWGVYCRVLIVRLEI